MKKLKDLLSSAETISEDVVSDVLGPAEKGYLEKFASQMSKTFQADVPTTISRIEKELNKFGMTLGDLDMGMEFEDNGTEDYAILVYATSDVVRNVYLSLSWRRVSGQQNQDVADGSKLMYDVKLKLVGADVYSLLDDEQVSESIEEFEAMMEELGEDIDDEGELVAEAAKLKFFYNGIKGSSGKLQKVHYSKGTIHDEDEITIYGKHYKDFDKDVADNFQVVNNTDSQTDYFEQDRIRVKKDHPLYKEVLAAHNAQAAKWDRVRNKAEEKRKAKHAARYGVREGAEELNEEVWIAHGRQWNAKTFNSDKAANAFLEKNSDYGVIGEKNGKVYVAKNADKGSPIKKESLDEAITTKKVGKTLTIKEGDHTLTLKINGDQSFSIGDFTIPKNRTEVVMEKIMDFYMDFYKPKE